MTGWMDDVHGQCLAWREVGKRTDVCRKSKGHDTSGATPARRQHCDPDHDQRWSDEEKP